MSGGGRRHRKVDATPHFGSPRMGKVAVTTEGEFTLYFDPGLSKGA